MGKFEDMVEGYSRLFKLKDTDKDQEDIIEARMQICANCDNRNDQFNTCKVCGCYIPAKTRCMTCSCPKKFW